MGAWVYQALSQQLGGAALVLALELPGHNSRMKETCYTCLRQLAEDLVSVVTTLAGYVRRKQRTYLYYL